MSTHWIRHAARPAVALVFALAVSGCATLRLTRRESVDLLAEALARLGYARNELNVTSNFRVTHDRFAYQETNYEVAEDTVVAEDGSRSRRLRRGKEISDRRIDLLWSDVSRVYIKKADRLDRGGSVGEFVVIEFRSRDRRGRWATETFAIGEIFPGVNAPRDLAYDLVVAVRTLSGHMLPATHPRYRTARYRWPQEAVVTDPVVSRPAPVAPVPPPAPSLPSEPAQTTRERELRELKHLHERGLISDEAYQERQLQILGRP